MDINKFGAASPGTIVSVEGLSTASHAFIPHSLPAEWRIPDDLWPRIVEARTAIAALDGIMKHLPNPALLLTPLQHREAQLSSQLEGTVTNPQQQLLFELDSDFVTSDQADIEALREVSNYRRALAHYRTRRDSLPISLRLVRELHGILLGNVRGAEADPGAYRRILVQIGKPARFVPPPPHLIGELLHNLERFFHQPMTRDPLIDCFLIHYQFEAIHPFRHGNGRIGRLLLSIMIAERCGLSENWLYLSAFFDAHRDQYLDRLFAISATGAWMDWIEFCLQGTIVQALDTERRSTLLLDLLSRYKNEVYQLAASNRLIAIIEQLLINPIVRISVLAKSFNVSYPTAKADVEKLAALGILKPIEGLRPRTFYCSEIFDLIYAQP